MALFNKLFSNKRKNVTPLTTTSATSLPAKNVNSTTQKCSSTQFPFHKSQVRVLLYRDCDWRGRRLLFDSSAIECIEMPKHEFPMAAKKAHQSLSKNNTPKSGVAAASVKNGCGTPQNQHIEYFDGFAYKYNRPNSDYHQIGEMLFGSVALSFRGTALKVHWLKSPSRVLCSQVSLSPVQPQYISPNTTVTSANHLTTSSDTHMNPSMASDISSLDTSSMSSFSISLSVCGNDSYNNNNNNNNNKRTIPLDVPKNIIKENGTASGENATGDGRFYPHSASDSGYGGTDPWSMARYHYSSTRSSLASIFSDQCENMRKLSIESSSLVDIPPLMPLLPQPTSDGSLNRRILRNSATSLENSQSKSDFVGLIGDGPQQAHQYSSNALMSDNNCFSKLRRNSEIVGNSNNNGSQITVDTVKRKAVSGDAIGMGYHHQRTHRSSRRSRMGIAICVTLTDSVESEMLAFTMEHIVLFESILSRLQQAAENAYVNRQQFLQIMLKGWHATTQWIDDLFTAPRLANPVWITLSSGRSSICDSLDKTSSNLSRTFMNDLNFLLTSADTKDTNFFISTLLTAVLTHHLGWVGTIASLDNTANVDSTKEQNSKISEVGKSYPYNVLWAQLGDLYGAIGYPIRLSKTLVYGNCQQNQIMDKLLNVLTYFIRCGVVRRKTEESLKKDYTEKINLEDAINTNHNILGTEVNLTLLNGDNRNHSQNIPKPTIHRGDGLKRSPTSHKGLSRSETAFKLDDLSSHLEPGDPKRPEMLKMLKKNVMNDIPKVMLYRESRMVRQELRIGNEKMDTGVEMNAREKLFLQKYIKATTAAAAVKDQIKLTVTDPDNNVEVEEAIQLDLNGMTNENNLSQLLTAENLQTLQNLIEQDAIKFAEMSSLSSTSLDSKMEESKAELISESLLRSKSMFVKNTTSHMKEKRQHLKQYKFVRKSSVPKIEQIPTDSDKPTATNTTSNGVLFVLGDDEELIGLKHSPLPKPVNIVESIAGTATTTTCKHKYKKHSGVKFNFEQYPQIANNYMKNKNLELPNYELFEKANKLSGNEATASTSEFRPSLSKTKEDDAEEECECCRANGSQYYLQTPTNASDIEFSNEMESENFESASSSSKPASGKFTVTEIKSVNEPTTPQIPIMLPFPPMVHSKLTSSKRVMKTLREEIDEKVPAKVILELPLAQSENGDVNKTTISGFGTSLFTKTTDHYIPDMILQGTTASPTEWEHTLRQDLALSSRCATLESVPTENVAIIANIEKWDVRIMSSHSFVLSSSNGSPGIVGMSQLVSTMLETVHAMWSCGLAEKQCLSYIESKLREFYLQSETLATFLLATEFCSLSTLTSSLNLTDNDIPLLMSIASYHSPRVTRKYGVSFR